MTNPKDLNFPITRRSFIVGTAAIAASPSAALFPSPASSEAAPRVADYQESLGDGRVRCLLCPHGCTISEGKRGKCRVRENRKGTLYSLSYGRPCSIHVDPIEKKPFFHFLPGTISFSISTVGCNMSCKFCQNWQISQSSPEDLSSDYRESAGIVSLASTKDVASMAYTYGEPVVFTEYVMEIARIARATGLRNVVVTNGYYNEKPLNDLCSLVDAIKVDLKSFEDSYYRKICGGTLNPVLDSLVRIKKAGVWLEIVYLMIPTLNDSQELIRAMSRWISDNLGPDVPVHYSRFFPDYLLKNLPPTPVPSLETARDISLEEGIRYVYIGNVTGHPAESTYCPFCQKKIVSRRGYIIEAFDIVKGNCRFCGKPIAGIWSEENH